MNSEEKYLRRDYRNGFKRGFIDTSMHPIIVRRALNDELTFKKIIDEREELSEYSKSKFLHAYNLVAFDDREAFAEGYTSGACLGLALSVLSLGTINLIVNVIDAGAKKTLRNLEKYR